jgi:hypothetical protein
MKFFLMKFFFVLMILGLFSGLTVAQTDKNVSAIRKAVETVNRNSGKLKQSTVKLDGISTEGAELTVFRDKTEIKKINAQIFGEMGYSMLELYYQDEKPIFIYEREFRYEKPFGKVLKIIPTRFYFSGEKLVKMLYAKREIYTDDKEYNEMRDRIISLSKTIFEAAKDKAKTS